MGLPAPRKPSSNPPKDKLALPSNAILPGKIPPPKSTKISSEFAAELPKPRVNIISDEQKQALHSSIFSECEVSIEDPILTLAYGFNTAYFTALQRFNQTISISMQMIAISPFLYVVINPSQPEIQWW